MKKLLFIVLLTLTTATMVYSFVYNHLILQTYKLVYLNSNENIQEENRFCYETTTLDRYRFNSEEILFTLLNNLILGPQNIFLDSAFAPPLSIRKVYLLGNTLIVDFNRYLSELSEEEENLLLKVTLNALDAGFPEIEEMFWLSQGRKVPYIKSGYSYLYPIPIRGWVQDSQTQMNYATLPHC